MSNLAPHPRPRRLAALGVALGLVGAFAAGPAFAHDELVSSDPSADAQIEVLPDAVTLTFSGVLIDEPGINRVSVTDAAGTELTEGDPVLDGTLVTQALGETSAGEITVVWRVVSSDGHPVSGEYSFVAGDAADAPTPSESADADESAAGEDTSWLLWVVGGVVVVGAGVAVAAFAASRRRTED